ncbi:MAG: VWA domain-containing protein, partial [Chloroflexota bacterium]
FVVDASGSMAARKRMVAVKGAILSLLIDAYQKRDTVGMIAFRGDGLAPHAGAEVVLRPTNSVELAQRQLQRLPTGGKTPLADGLLLAEKVLNQQELRENRVEPLVVVLSDGRGNVARDGIAPLEGVKIAAGRIAEKGWKSVVIDCESGYPRLGLAGVMAQAMGGDCVKLDELSAESVSGLVKSKMRESHNID